jgi:hypothetical protein
VSALDVEIEKRLEEIRMEEDRVRKEGIRGLLRKAKGFRLQPFRYMVSWNGVLVLAFTGFPGIVLKLKNGLNKFEHLVKENPGSTWPKCKFKFHSEFRKEMREKKNSKAVDE